MRLQYKYIVCAIALFTGVFKAQAQDSLKTYTLDDVIFVADKNPESHKKINQNIISLNASQIGNYNAASTADLLQNSGKVIVQKSQQGGGSPVLRGFEASRILMVVDGVRMNNLIYRAGHLQNIITIDQNMLDKIEILNGPGSTIYGSDALGGVIHFYTKNPKLNNDLTKKKFVSGNAYTRFATVNNENSVHLDLNLGFKKWAFLTSITGSKFGDVYSGRNQNPFSNETIGERNYYVDPKTGYNHSDSVMLNKSQYLQKNSGYSQIDFMEKILFQQNPNVKHILNLQYSNSTDVPRYDRLTDMSGGKLKYAEWYYGPQKRIFASYNLDYNKPTAISDNIKLILSNQMIDESRNDRKLNSEVLNHRLEQVSVQALNLDIYKVLNTNNKISYGIEVQNNSLKSTAEGRNWVTGEVSKIPTRYPDGTNSMLNMAAYFSHHLQITDKLTLNDGIRLGYSNLHSTLKDTTLFYLPYTDIKQSTPVYSGSIGLVHNTSDNWKLSALISTGYRVPNIDDMSKIFESAGDVVIVPNSKIKPEQTVNYEIGITHFISNKTNWETNIFYTDFLNAMQLSSTTYNGKDSLLYNGTMAKAYSMQNKNRGYLYGINSVYRTRLSEDLTLNLGCTYTYGRIRNYGIDEPLDHIAPFTAFTNMQYHVNRVKINWDINFNGRKSLANYSSSGEDNLNYAGPNGLPAWIVTNINAAYSFKKYITVQAGVDNIFDTQYRVFASGINAPGRNLKLCLRASF